MSSTVGGRPSRRSRGFFRGNDGQIKIVHGLKYYELLHTTRVFCFFFFLFAKHHRHAESDAHVAAQRQAPQVREFQGNVRPGVSRWVRARLPRRVRDGEEGQEQSEEARARTHRPRELLKSQIDETWRDRATFLSRHGRRARRWRRRCRARPLEAPPAPLPPPGAAHIRG